VPCSGHTGPPQLPAPSDVARNSSHDCQCICTSLWPLHTAVSTWGSSGTRWVLCVGVCMWCVCCVWVCVCMWVWMWVWVHVHITVIAASGSHHTGQKLKHTHKRIHTHTQAHTHTHTLTHTQAHTHTHIHTHRHKRWCVSEKRQAAWPQCQSCQPPNKSTFC